MIRFKSMHAISMALLLVWFVPGITSAAQISISNLDGAGEGLNDTTAVTPVGGNSGTTLGDQRLKVLEYAAKIWGSVLTSNINIIVEASFDPLTCSASQAILGSAGAKTAHVNFANAPFPSTLYAAATANSLANTDLSAANADIATQFNSDLDNNNNCLNNTNWYYGLDGNRPGGTIELLTVVQHEISHGLGFQTFVDVATGAKLASLDDAYMRNLEDHSKSMTWNQLATDAERQTSAIDDPDLHWVGAAVTGMIGSYSAGVDGGHIRMHAPNPLVGGSSVSHFSTVLAPNELMEPIDTGPKSGPGLARELMIDLGWNTFADSKPFLGTFADDTVLEGDAISLDFVIGDDDTPLVSLLLTGASSNTLLVDNNDILISGTGRARTLQVTALSGNIGTAAISVTVDDGTSTAIETFDLTLLFNNPPVINTQSPVNGGAFQTTDSIVFQATATDTEDGDIAANIQWDSSLDGAIGTGASFSTTLSQGTHTITASVTDSLGKNASTALSVSVTPPGDSDGDGLDDAWELTFFGNLNQDGTGDYDTDGLTESEEEQLATDPTLDDTDGDRVNDGDEVNTYNIDPLLSNTGDVAPRGAQNNQLDAGDAVVLMRLVTGTITPDTLESILADINNDNDINAADLLLLQQLLIAAP